MESDAFPIVSSTDLQDLKSGQTPPDFPFIASMYPQSFNIQIVPNVKIKVPAGTFNTIEVKTGIFGSVIYIDQNTGLLVWMNMTSFTIPPTEFHTYVMELANSNVIASSSSTLITLTIVVIVIFIIAIVLLLFIMNKKREQYSDSAKLTGFTPHKALDKI
ncbi:MAG: hypothetical protein ACP5FU_02065 [Nitrososphaeria archaeon]